jgi:hypothetical protein
LTERLRLFLSELEIDEAAGYDRPLFGGTRMPLPDRLRLPLAFNPDRLAHDMRTVESSGWIAHFVPQNYEGEWSIIPLRAKAGATHPIMMISSDPTCRDYADTPMLAACPYFREVLHAFEAPLRSVRLMRLGPGSVIKEHTDLELSFEEGTVRIHVPVATNPEVEFFLNRERVILEAGSAWYLRLSDPHSVVNRGTSERVHMVIDAEVNHWVADVLARAASGYTAPRVAPNGASVTS